MCDGGQSREDTLRGVGGAAGRAERYCGERLRGGGVDAVRGGEPGGNHEERAARSGGGAPCGGGTAVGPRGRALSDPGRPSPPSPPPRPAPRGMSAGRPRFPSGPRGRALPLCRRSRAMAAGGSGAAAAARGGGGGP